MIKKMKPSRKLTVGAQYICMVVPDENGEFQPEYETEVLKLPTLVDVDFSDVTDPYNTYASGDLYESESPISAVEIAETNVAFPDALVEKLRGHAVVNGVALGGGPANRPYFAYGTVIKKKNGTLDLRWYPKCKLTENSDKTETSEESNKDQNDTIKLKAYSYNGKGNCYIRALTENEALKNLTEEQFFEKPLLTAEEVNALVSA